MPNPKLWLALQTQIPNPWDVLSGTLLLPPPPFVQLLIVSCSYDTFESRHHGVHFLCTIVHPPLRPGVSPCAQYCTVLVTVHSLLLSQPSPGGSSSPPNLFPPFLPPTPPPPPFPLYHTLFSSFDCGYGFYFYFIEHLSWLSSHRVL